MPQDARVQEAAAWRQGATWTLGALALANLVNYAARNVLAPAHDDLRTRFDASDPAIGALATVYMAGHALATLPAGWLGDRFDRHRIIVGALFLAAVGSALSVVAPSVWTLALARLAVGVGTAAVVPIGNSVLGQLFDGPRKASRIAVFNLGLFLGGIVGIGAGTVLGFPLAPWGLAVLAMAAALSLARRPAPPSRARPQARPVGTQLRQLWAVRPLRWVIAGTTTMAFAAGGYMEWFIDFLKVEKGMTAADAMQLLIACSFAGLAGVLVGGTVGDRARRRWGPAGRPTAIVFGMALTAPCALGCILLPLGPALIVAAVGTMFFISWYHAPMAALVDDLAPLGMAVSAQALVIFCMHLVGTAPGATVVGWVSGRWGLTVAMVVPTVAVAIAAGLMWIARTRCVAGTAATGTV